MNDVAERYVKLVLAIGKYDDNYVDAYYGPPSWREEAEASAAPLPELRGTALQLLSELAKLRPSAGDEDEQTLRWKLLYKLVRSAAFFCAMKGGKRFTFDEEARYLYDCAPPRNPEEHFQKLVAQVDSILPGAGSGKSLSERWEAFRSQFIVPKDRLDATFRAAIEECRRRTAKHIPLPAGENFEVGYVSGKPWSAYNWFKGNNFSLIEVNTELPIFIDRIIDLACHEGYPGHHVFNSLLENENVRARGWMEFCVSPLFAPTSLIAEGTANYGIDVAFPGDERVAFEAQALFPLAGLDPGLAPPYYKALALVKKLAYAGNEAARGYLNGDLPRDRAVDWLVRFELSTPERAAQRVRFIETYRSYVINYNLGQDLTARFVEKRGGTADRPDERWRVYRELLALPRVPSELAGEPFALDDPAALAVALA
eukprot:tig00000215_g18676.t1